MTEQSKTPRGDEVLIEGMAKQLRSLRKKNTKLKAENERLTRLLEQIKPMARIGIKVFNSNLKP